jgi:hypothetical protein
MNQPPYGSEGDGRMMTTHNPYAPPQAAGSPQAAGLVYGARAQYVPLRWRTTVAAIAVFATTTMGLVLHLAMLSLREGLTESTTGETPNVASALVVGALGMGVLAAGICAWVFVPIWIHRAASNLRGLGRYGMAFTPGSCVWWFFVPFANLWKPPQAMAEIWRASDPEADEASWLASSRTPLIAIWWTGWLLSGLVSWCALLIGKGAVDGLGLVSDTCGAFAAVALVLFMRRVSARQERVAARLQGIG